MANNKITLKSSPDTKNRFMTEYKPKTSKPRTTGELMGLLALYPSGTVLTVNCELLSIKSMEHKDGVLNLEIE